MALAAAPWEGDDPAPAASPTTTSRPRSTTTVPPTTTTGIPPVFLPERTGGVRLLLARTGAVDVVDIDANTIVSQPVVGLSARVDDGRYFASPTMARRGDHLVFQDREATFAVPLDFSDPPRRLGSSVLFLPSSADDRVWLVSRADDGAPSVREVDLQGRSAAAAVPLLPDWAPRAAVEGGLVLTRGGRFQVWDPATGRTRFASEDGTDPVAASGRLVAWRYYCDGPFCPLHLTDVVTGRDRAVYVETGPSGPGQGAFSPDGRTLAYFVQRTVEGGRLQAAVAFVDVASGRTTFTKSVIDFALLSWSASGRWVFSTGPGSASAVVAFRPGLDVGLQIDLGPRRDGFDLVVW